jgi:hypothetical protein
VSGSRCRPRTRRSGRAPPRWWPRGRAGRRRRRPPGRRRSRRCSRRRRRGCRRP